MESTVCARYGYPVLRCVLPGFPYRLKGRHTTVVHQPKPSTVSLDTSATLDGGIADSKQGK